MTWNYDVDGPSWLPVERILWAPTNSAHYNHLHVVGLPRLRQDELPTSFQVTDPIEVIMAALDEEFGVGDHYQVNDDSLGWTHMGIYNDRFIGDTSIWSQHAGGNAIDIGPYNGLDMQQKFYDFLTLKEDTMALTKHEEDVLKQAVAALDEVESNGTALKYMVLHLRDHPTGSTTDSHARTLARKALNKLQNIKNAI